MNDMSATWTVLARSDADPFGNPLVTPIMRDAVEPSDEENDE